MLKSSATQWAAVITVSLSIKLPPHQCLPLNAKLIKAGQLLGTAILPPIIFVLGVFTEIPHSLFIKYI